MIYDLKIIHIDETKGRIFNTKEIKWMTKVLSIEKIHRYLLAFISVEEDLGVEFSDFFGDCVELPDKDTYTYCRCLIDQKRKDFRKELRNMSLEVIEMERRTKRKKEERFNLSKKRIEERLKFKVARQSIILPKNYKDIFDRELLRRRKEKEKAEARKMVQKERELEREKKRRAKATKELKKKKEKQRLELMTPIELEDYKIKKKKQRYRKRKKRLAC